MDFNLPQLITTTQDIDLLNKEIDILIDSLYRTGNLGFDNVITKGVRNSTAKMLETLGPTKPERKATLEKIKENLKKMKIMRLTLAFEPSPEVIEKTIIWSRVNVGEDIVLDFKLDESIVGGAIIEYEGKYIDVSLRRKLEGALYEII